MPLLRWCPPSHSLILFLLLPLPFFPLLPFLVFLPLTPPSSHSFPSCSSYPLTPLSAAYPVLSPVSGEWQQAPLRKAVSPPWLQPAHKMQGPSRPAVASGPVGPGPSSGLPPPNLSSSSEDLMDMEDQVLASQVKYMRSRGPKSSKGLKGGRKIVI